MLFSFAASTLALASVATAHFSVEYPYWRGDSFEAPASQWVWPCANVNQTTSANNRTEWPLTGGSVVLDMHHPWAPTYINIGMGNNVTTFNVSLVAAFNETGNGTFCLPEVGKEALAMLNVTEGMNATIQVVTLGTTGSALYNCADITFTSKAKPLAGHDCMNSTNVGGEQLMGMDMSMGNMSMGGMGGSGNGSSGSGSSGSSSGSSGAGTLSVPRMAALGMAVGLGALLL